MQIFLIFFLHKHLLHSKTAEMLQKATSRKSECLPYQFHFLDNSAHHWLTSEDC